MRKDNSKGHWFWMIFAMFALMTSEADAAWGEIQTSKNGQFIYALLDSGPDQNQAFGYRCRTNGDGCTGMIIMLGTACSSNGASHMLAGLSSGGTYPLVAVCETVDNGSLHNLVMVTDPSSWEFDRALLEEGTLTVTMMLAKGAVRVMRFDITGAKDVIMAILNKAAENAPPPSEQGGYVQPNESGEF